ncbi:MAG: hypothetical protein ACI4MY_04600, partial [Christensenellales bacterium]
YTSQYGVEFVGAFGHIHISMLPHAVLTFLVLLVSTPREGYNFTNKYYINKYAPIAQSSFSSPNSHLCRE